ncbi:zf-TFIIB domain-containing protein [Roseateles sp. NT4]|uniref:zf-TFIIB domain-containing protein n=1 Tax=Roseateles sp. NT4 TaxID=3453715 RepID=UPI003EEED84D
MSMASSRPCPSCGDAMQLRTLPAHHGASVDIDFCFACHGIWFDHQENLKLAPEAIATVFREMHRHQGEPRHPLKARLSCAQCRSTLVQGFDIVRSGRYITHRCPQQHGRFSSFSSFMIEKGFVRQLTRPEIADIAAKVGTINCSNCGAPVDLRKEDACSHCRSALSLLDPQAVEQALAGYAKAAAKGPTPEGVADALAMLARDRARAERESRQSGYRPEIGSVYAVDLVAVGLGLISTLWDD